ncbi:hypothetical protein OKW40_000850 [Paraburkholderia sp. RAU6.4a]|uniref:hypothetical protein n=1 Tax=unclassified Paraburkholderia TaxID=2615204 RepID=UPI001620FE90|nr:MULTISPECIES: hypothetical protein [unclassified Paraburkholderia]MBB5413481.1 hypothetical protein [Paraburkholderia sp. HC6.4b]MBB5455896.1 hypothetical protein [Paraburkholderia sp. Kb1A]
MKLAYPTRRVLRADGTTQALEGPRTMAQIEALIGPDCECCDTVMLDGLHVMIVDDLGYRKGLPVNENATALYLLRCGPGVDWQIRGDVVIVPDDDFSPAALKH